MASKILSLDGIRRGADMFQVDPLLIQVRPGHNPRTVFDEASMAELEASILQNGLREALTISLDGTTVYLVDGERRMRAILNLIAQGHRDKFQHVPAIQQHPSRCSEADLLLTAMIKNQSEPLVPLDMARACQRFILDFHWTIEEVGQKLGRSTATIRNLLLLLEATPAIQEMIEQGQAHITEVVQAIRHADKAGVPQETALAGVRHARTTALTARRATAAHYQDHATRQNGAVPSSPLPLDDQEDQLRALLASMDRETALAVVFEVIPKAVVAQFLETGELQSHGLARQYEMKG